MFTQGFATLMSRFRPDAVLLPRVARMRAVQAEGEASQALNCALPDMLLSERLSDPDGWRSIQQSRRRALEALLAVPPTKETIARAADLIALISEESTWSANPSGEYFDEENHPEIDFQCAETAVLFGWTKRILGDALNVRSPRIVSRMVAEVRRRALRPAQVHDDYAFMTGGGARPMAIAADLLLAALLLEPDEARLSRALRPMLRILDDCCSRHGRAFAPLTDVVADVSAVSDLVVLLREMTDDALDLTGQLPAGDWLDEILYAWIHDRLFVDPAGDGMQPALSGGDIFRIGHAAGDDQLTALGAMVWHQQHLPSATTTGRLRELSACALMESAFGRPKRLRYAHLRDNRLMAARIPGLYCALHTGGGRGNAGDLCLFADEAPILVDSGRSCPVKNVPVLNDLSQLTAPFRPCIADFEDREDREVMSVDLTAAYPKECGLRSYQRTALTLRPEQTVRIVDALAFDQPCRTSFRFVTAVRPTVLSTAIRLGPVRLTWEGEFTISASPLDNNLTLLEFTAAEPVRQALFSFSFERA